MSSGSAPDAVVSKLQKQLDYYFSDANLRRDAHLRGLAGAKDDATLRQWVDLEHVLAFARARAILDEVPTATDGDRLSAMTQLTNEPAKKRAKKTIPAAAQAARGRTPNVRRSAEEAPTPRHRRMGQIGRRRPHSPQAATRPTPPAAPRRQPR